MKFPSKKVIRRDLAAIGYLQVPGAGEAETNALGDRPCRAAAVDPDEAGRRRLRRILVAELIHPGNQYLATHCGEHGVFTDSD